MNAAQAHDDRMAEDLYAEMMAGRAKPERPAYRPLLSAPAAAYWTDETGRLCVLLSSRRKADAYELIPLSTDLGGCAFRWFKTGGESYDVLVHGADSSCTCKGWAYTGGCRHIQTTFELLELGAMAVAPGSAGGECDDAA
jgi:hypothetical protein